MMSVSFMKVQSLEYLFAPGTVTSDDVDIGDPLDPVAWCQKTPEL